MLWSSQNVGDAAPYAPGHGFPDAVPVSFCYDKFFPQIGVVRHRRHHWTCSLLKINSTFMKLQNGGLTIYVKLACTFFQHGRLVAEEICPIDGGYRLTCEKEWGYVRPLADIHQPDWWKIDKDARERANMQKHRWQADVLFTEDGLTLGIQTTGTPRIPAKLEFILPPGGLLRASGLTVQAAPGGWAVAGESASYTLGGDEVRISGCFNHHHYTANMRNSDPMPPGRFCLYCTGFTPLDEKLAITMINPNPATPFA